MRITTPVGKLDAEGQRLTFAVADLKARWLMTDISESEYNAGNKGGACRFMHAEVYLRDRLVYELAPWPKDHIINPVYVESWGKE